LVYNFTKEDCISELQKVYSSSGLENITRNYFREHSTIPERIWENYFGNFNEFKKQADLLPSRHAQQIVSQIAKHASKDKLRAFNIEKQGYEGKYNRDSSKGYQTVLVGSDIHDTLSDPFYVRLFIETAARVKPERIILNGDIFDFPEFSKFTIDPREYNVLGRIEWVHSFLRDLRETSPDSQIDFNSGNHEHRLLRHLGESTPAMLTLLSDLHGFTVSSLLGLDKFEVNFISKDDLAVFSYKDMNNELKKNYVIVNDQLLFHHFPEGINMGMPGANGHNHKFLATSKFNPTFGSYNWIQIGTGHRRQASYCDGSKWNNGFLLYHMNVNSKRSQAEYIDCTSDFCVIGGEMYQRTDSEMRYYC
jgi:hypothetical protein